MIGSIINHDQVSASPCGVFLVQYQAQLEQKELECVRVVLPNIDGGIVDIITTNGSNDGNLVHSLPMTERILLVRDKPSLGLVGCVINE